MPVVGYGHLVKFIGSDYQKSVPDVEIHYYAPSEIILITAKNKYLQISNQNLTQEMLSFITLQENEINQIQKVSGINDPLQLYSFVISQSDRLKIITFNIASQVQRNIPSGSEEILVRACQAKYPKYGGWSEHPKNGHLILSQCTFNTAIWLASHHPDLIGLQESTSTHLFEIVEAINRRTSHQYESVGAGPVQFIYNIESFGKGYLLSPPDLHMIQIGRRMIIVWFPQIKLLAVNLHAPHQVDLKKQILDTFNTVPINVNPDRIVMMGDFNDAYNQPLTQLTIMNKILRQHGSPPHSCCTDMEYRLIGDYIFDSEYQRSGFYGIPDDA